MVAIVAIGGIATACRLPMAPDVSVLTISGYVYQQETQAGEPPLVGVLITVEAAPHSPQTTLTNEVGFYTISVQGGSISISASKVGYATRTSNFDMSLSTVLNFSLTPS